MSDITMSVSEVSDFVAAIVAAAVPEPIWVEGEIANISRSAKGHVYFTLIEPGERAGSNAHSLSVTLLNWHREKVNLNLRRAGGNVRMGDGVRVRVRGHLELYQARSQLQLRMIAIDPIFTLGTLAAERSALIAELKAEGLLELNASLAVPQLPHRIALVTSVGSAAHADFCDEIRSAAINIAITEFDSRVQGSDAAVELCAAIQAAGHCDAEVIAIVRGGGAKTDLAVFDHPDVVRAICQSHVAVFTGLGHETDDSVADLVATRAHKTPTACAADIVRRCIDGVTRLESLWAQVSQLSTSTLDRHSQRLDRFSRRSAQAPAAAMQRAQRQLDLVAHRLPRAANAPLVLSSEMLDNATDRVHRQSHVALDSADKRVVALSRTVKAYDPAETLRRGWSISRDASGNIASAASLNVGDTLTTELADGTVGSTISSTSAKGSPS